MKLGMLMEALKDKEVHDFKDVEVKGIASNSSHVKKGYVFIAIKGTHTDGHLFVEDAVKNGAVACVTEVPTDSSPAVNVVVPDTAKAVSLLASRFYGDPAGELWMCGVTGTNGKTSTAHMLRSICETSSWGRVGVVGTLGHGVGASLEEARHTTPDPVKLHELFLDMKKLGCRGVVMEVSSHAVRQRRTWGIEFEIGILTNVTRDHLDYHKNIEDYISAKEEFCMSLAGDQRKKEKGTLVFSRDDTVARSIGEKFPGDSVSVGLSGEADVSATSVAADLTGTRFIMRLASGGSIPVDLKILGRFNIYNALLAAAAAEKIGITKDDIKKGLEALKSIPGRFEAIGGEKKPLVIVDYSHTPDSLERVLRFSLELKPRRLITVFGCGGDRDRGKRPIMGRIAQRLSHACYVTSDNPRTENPEEIMEDILGGMDKSLKWPFVEVDRRKAIRRAIMDAREGDIVAICGKGHEDYQIIGKEKIHFDDREEAREALAMWKEH